MMITRSSACVRVAVVFAVALAITITAAAGSATPPGANAAIVFTRYFDTDHSSGALFTNNPAGTLDLGPSRRAQLPRSALVGQWQRVTTCKDLVGDLKRAGLGATVAQAWLGQTSSTGESSSNPGSPKPTRAHPCRGAIARKHSHFFTASGNFGSLDWHGGQVDDGSYRIVNRATVEINGISFHFAVKNGNTLSLAAVLTRTMIRRAVAHPANFTPAFWAVTVAHAGRTWKRVRCSKCG
jgi:hypothetical protein